MYYHPTNTPRYVDISSLSSQRINDLQVVISKARLCSTCDLIEDNPRSISAETNHYHPWSVCQRSILLDKSYKGMVGNSIQGVIDFNSSDGVATPTIIYDPLPSSLLFTLPQLIATTPLVEYKYLNGVDSPSFNNALHLTLNTNHINFTSEDLVYLYSAVFDVATRQPTRETGNITLIMDGNLSSRFLFRMEGLYRTSDNRLFEMTLHDTQFINGRAVLNWEGVPSRSSANPKLTLRIFMITPVITITTGRLYKQSEILNSSFYYRNIIGAGASDISSYDAQYPPIFVNESTSNRESHIAGNTYKLRAGGTSYGYSNFAVFADPTDRTRLHTVFDGGGDIILQAGSGG